ncbi:MAG: hypothetical protein IT204_06405 [Fimbriimonadaceae bacterium]|nr:hypothetical protein [Fimbriimonadaceae bacterium]
MEITKRDLAILGGFSALLTLGVYTVFVKANAPAAGSGESTRPRAVVRSREAERTASATAGAEPERAQRSNLSPAVSGATVPTEYRVISQRRLFEPLIRVQSKAPAQQVGQLPPVPRVTAPAQTPAKPASSKPPATARPPESNRGGSSTPATLPAPPLAVTGLMAWGDGYRVVVENTELKYTRVAKVGDEVWGYRITEVSEDTREVKVDRPSLPGGQTATLKLGEGKKVETPQAGGDQSGQKPPEASATPSAPQPQPGSGGYSGGMSRFGGFDPRRLTPEQRARWDDWQRRRGEGGGGFGRGR